jgi:hypothetical protein
VWGPLVRPPHTEGGSKLKEGKEKDMPDDISKELEAVEGDEETDDYFEKVLETELELPTDDDPEEDKKEESEEEEAKEPTIEEQLKAANDKVTTLEKEAKGRLKDTVESRQQKSSMKAELTELKSAVSSLLAKRDDALKPDEDPAEETSKKGVEFDEDDKAFVDLEDVHKKIEDEGAKTQEQIDELKDEKVKEQQTAAFNQEKNEIIGEDAPAFEPSFPVLQEAFKDLNDAVVDLQNRLEIADNDDGTVSQDHALELLDGSPELEEFSKKYPGIDPIKIARAFNTKLDFRISLRDIADINKFGASDNDDDTKSDEKEISEKIKKAKDKPGSLAGSSDQAGGTADLLTRIHDLPTQDIMDFTNDEIKKVELMLEKEARGE